MGNKLLQLLLKYREQISPVSLQGYLTIVEHTRLNKVGDFDTVADALFMRHLTDLCSEYTVVKALGEISHMQGIVGEWVKRAKRVPDVIIVDKDKPRCIWELNHPQPVDEIVIGVYGIDNTPLYPESLLHTPIEHNRTLTQLVWDTPMSGRVTIKNKYRRLLE